MNALTTHDTWLQSPYQIESAINERLEAQETAIRARITSDAEALANAVFDYYDSSTRILLCDGPELLTEFTLALAGAAKLIDAIAHGDPLPDSELRSFRALCRQSEIAVRRQAVAVQDAVDVEMAK